ncbi:uncharacterized protein MONBRDRAFT_22300, partial [Monosiga brevicollis MX1]
MRRSGVLLMLAWMGPVIATATFAPPSDWEDLIATGNLLWHNSTSVAPGYQPNIGNGYIGHTVGCGPAYTPGQEEGSGRLHLAGVFNGQSFVTPSHRAGLPSPFMAYPIEANGAPVVFNASGLDLQAAIFRNRTRLPACGDAVLEMRLLAHRELLNLEVLQLVIRGRVKLDMYTHVAETANASSTRVVMLYDQVARLEAWQPTRIMAIVFGMSRPGCYHIMPSFTPTLHVLCYDAAREEAAAYGYPGAFYPWESAATGSGLVGFPYTTRARSLFKGSLLLMRVRAWLVSCLVTAEFPSIQACPLGSISEAILARIQHDSGAYTNALVSSVLNFTQEVAALIGATVPSNYSLIADQMYLPLVDDLYAGGPVHPEYEGYQQGQAITQSAVGLLQYPLAITMPVSVAQNDLLYYQAVTRDNGYFTGDSSYAIAWARLGNMSAANEQFARTFRYLSPDDPYFLFKEEAVTGNNINFLTGAGGFLQSILYGFGGLDVTEEAFMLHPRLPDVGGVRALTWASVRYRSVCFDVHYNATNTCLRLHESYDGSSLVVNDEALLVGQETCVPA